MKYNKLGNSGLEVSRICLGCMGFGEASSGMHDWSIDEAKDRPIVERVGEVAREKGVIDVYTPMA